MNPVPSSIIESCVLPTGAIVFQ